MAGFDKQPSRIERPAHNEGNGHLAGAHAEVDAARRAQPVSGGRPESPAGPAASHLEMTNPYEKTAANGSPGASAEASARASVTITEARPAAGPGATIGGADGAAAGDKKSDSNVPSGSAEAAGARAMYEQRFPWASQAASPDSASAPAPQQGDSVTKWNGSKAEKGQGQQGDQGDHSGLYAKQYWDIPKSPQ